MNERPISFRNKGGQMICGIAHIPDIEEKKHIFKIGINLLNPGIKYRVAPNRLNVKISRLLCSKGYHVFRFDPPGIGDSEGELPNNTPIPDIFESIQKGRFVDDIIETNNFISKTFDLNRIILIGNCGGAITSLLVSRLDERVSDLCLIDVPVNLRAANMTFADKLVEGGEKADLMFEKYINKMMSVEAWIRIVTFRSNYKAIYKICLMKAKKLFRIGKGDVNLPKKIEKLCDEGKLNRQFFESFEAALQSDTQMLFILAENDSGTEFFREYVQKGYIEAGFSQSIAEKLVQVYQIDQANHVYTLVEWQEELMRKICSWLDQICTLIACENQIESM